MRNLKIRYRKSLLGMLWTVLIPAGSALVYFTVFKFVLKVQIPHYLLHILSGIIPWTFFAASVMSGLESIVANHRLLNKVPLPVQALTLSEILTHFLNFILSLPVIAVVMLLTWTAPTPAIIQFPILTALLLLQTYSIGIILSIGFVYLRDLRHLMGIILQFWFYLTPIMYRTEMIPEKYRIFLYLNPIGTMFAGFHASVSEGVFMSSEAWLSCFAWTASLFLIALLMFKKFRFRVVELV